MLAIDGSFSPVALSCDVLYLVTKQLSPRSPVCYDCGGCFVFVSVSCACVCVVNDGLVFVCVCMHLTCPLEHSCVTMCE